MCSRGKTGRIRIVVCKLLSAIIGLALGIWVHSSSTFPNDDEEVQPSRHEQQTTTWQCGEGNPGDGSRVEPNQVPPWPGCNVTVLADGRQVNNSGHDGYISPDNNGSLVPIAIIVCSAVCLVAAVGLLVAVLFDERRPKMSRVLYLIWLIVTGLRILLEIGYVITKLVYLASSMSFWTSKYFVVIIFMLLTCLDGGLTLYFMSIVGRHFRTLPSTDRLTIVKDGTYSAVPVEKVKIHSINASDEE